MSSIRARLFFVLMITTGIVWTSAAAWIYSSTRAQVEHALDARLTEAARMVSSLITSQQIDPQRAAQISSDPRIIHASYDRQLSCQIWGLDGTLVGRSEGAPAAPLTEETSGFSETDIDGETWRVYAVENKALGMRVLVGDNLKVRNHLSGRRRQRPASARVADLADLGRSHLVQRSQRAFAIEPHGGQSGKARGVRFQPAT